MSIRHRVEQTWRYALRSGGDERHAERTAEALRDMGADDDLIAAGLLHDIAKPRETRLWHRVAGVLLERSAPRLRRRLARGTGTLGKARAYGGLFYELRAKGITIRSVENDEMRRTR